LVIHGIVFIAAVIVFFHLMKNFRISFDFRKTVSVTENAEVSGDVIKRLLGYVASKCSTVWSLVATAESVTWL